MLKTVLFCLFFFIFLMLLFSITLIKIQINYTQKGKHDRLALYLSAWFGLLYYNYYIARDKLIKARDKTPNRSGRFMLKVLRNARLRKLTWHTEIGMLEPIYTGFLAGAVWSLKGAVLTVFYSLLNHKRVVSIVSVSPNFNGTCFNTTFDCIFEIRAGNILFVILKDLFNK